MDPSIIVEPAFVTTVFPGWNDVMGWAAPSSYLTIQCADIDGDGHAELLGRSIGSVGACHFDTVLGQWTVLQSGPTLADPGFWADWEFNHDLQYSSMRLADVDGDGQAELLAIWEDGIAVFHYEPGTQAWTPAPDTPMPNGPNLGFASLLPKGNMVSLQYADVDGDGQAELCAFLNEPAGEMVFWHCDKDTYAWTQMPSLQLSSGTDWEFFSLDPDTGMQYTATVRFGVVDGVLRLFVRASDGIYMYTYSASDGGWSEPTSANGPALTDAAGWNQPMYYSTIQCADIDGDGDAEIVARGPDGIYVFDYDSTSASWSPSVGTPNGPPLSDGAGWGQPQYYSTISCADINGDGQEELLARGPEGVYVFYYDNSTGTWSGIPSAPNGPPLSDEAGYNLPQSYLTIRFADIDGDGQDELMVRLADGVHTWKLDTATGVWGSASAQFPELVAYAAVSDLLTAGQSDDVRSEYSNLLQDLQSYLTALQDGPPPPVGISQSDWTLAVGQIASELQAAIDVQKLFSLLSPLVDDIFLSDDVSVPAVAETLGMSSTVNNSNDAVVANGIAAFANCCWALAALASAQPEIGVAIGLIASVASFATTFMAGHNSVPSNGIEVALAQLQTVLGDQFQAIVNCNGVNETTALTDYGLMMTMGSLIESNVWTWPPSLVADVQMQARQSYELGLFKILAPFVWVVFVSLDLSTPCSYPASWTTTKTIIYLDEPTTVQLYLTQGNTSHDCIQSALLSHLLDPQPGGLGASAADVLNSQNGWAFEYLDNFSNG